MTHKPVEEWVEPSYLDAVKAEVDAENQVLPQTGLSQPQISPLEIERQLLAKINLAYHSRFTLTQKQVQERWQFEKNISRPYFHVTKLPPAEVDTWHKYLDFEQRQGDYDRIAFLFERCLVACALYDKFWLRYARWMFSQGKEENARLIYMRACTLFIPVQRPNVRLKWARFEEKLGRFTIARDIHLAILEHVPDATKVIISLGGLIRRQHGIDLAVQFLEDQILRGTKIAGTLVGEQVRVLWVCKNKPEEARQVFKDKAALLSGDSNFWAAWLRFEIDQPATFNTEEQATDVDEAHARVKAVYEQIPRERFAFKVFKFLTKLYMQFLLSRGGSKVAVEYMELDMWGNGYPTPMEE
jgi:pre-mRNA-processing factor 39